MSKTIRVYARIRPVHSGETSAKICTCHGDTSILVHHPLKNQVLQFDLDKIFKEDSTQKDVYDNAIGTQSIHDLFNYGGKNMTVFAYGSTGSGKTFTMGHALHHNMKNENCKSQDCSTMDDRCMHIAGGSNYSETKPIRNSLHRLSFEEISRDDKNYGIMHRAVKDIFNKRQEILKSSDGASVHIKLSYIEIYNDEINDLLEPSGSNMKEMSPRRSLFSSPRSPHRNRFSTDALSPCSHNSGSSGISSLQLYERNDGEVEIRGITSIDLHSCAQATAILEAASKRRRCGETISNLFSSRSHAICTVTIIVNHRVSKLESMKQSKTRLTLVDLAGCEKIKKSGVQGEQKKESIMINKDLLTLGKVIHVLADMSERTETRSRTHVPYRDSKLTRLLKSSLKGSCRTIMVACICPTTRNLDESINTLRYAQRTKCIKKMLIVKKKSGPSLSTNSQTIANLSEENKMLKKRLKEIEAENSAKHSKQILDLEAQLEASCNELVAWSRRADKFEEKISHLTKSTKNLKPKVMPRSDFASPPQAPNVPPIKNSSEKKRGRTNFEKENQKLRIELDETRRERDKLKNEICAYREIHSKRRKFSSVGNNSKDASNSSLSPGKDNYSFYSQPKRAATPSCETSGNFLSLKSPDTFCSIDTPNFVQQREIRTNAKQVLKLASHAISSSRRITTQQKSLESESEKENKMNHVFGTSKDYQLLNFELVPSDLQQDTFYLPKVGNNSVHSLASDLEDIFRPWQFSFLRSIGITSVKQFLEAYKLHQDDLCSSLFMWVSNRNKEETNKKSCKIALHVWNRFILSNVAMKN